jgi:tetratricopeptide (TPR) repeat protein
MLFRSDSLFFAVLLCNGGAGGVLAAARQDCSPETIAQHFLEAHGYIGLADYARSERIFSTVLACQKQSLPANHLRIAVTLTNLGEAKRLQRQFGTAETLLKEAARLHEMAGRTEDPAFGSLQLILASVYKDRKQYHLAEPLVRQAMQIFDRSPGPESRQAAAALNTLAVLHAESGNLEGAERHLRKAIALRPNSPPDATTANVQHNLGKTLFEMGRAGEAEEWLVQAIGLRSQLLGRRHPSTRLTLEVYESLLKSTGRKAEARQVRTRARQGNGLAQRHALELPWAAEQ